MRHAAAADPTHFEFKKPAAASWQGAVSTNFCEFIVSAATAQQLNSRLIWLRRTCKQPRASPDEGQSRLKLSKRGQLLQDTVSCVHVNGVRIDERKAEKLRLCCSIIH